MAATGACRPSPRAEPGGPRRRSERLEQDKPPADAVAGFRAHYLSDGHVARPGVGCPVAALGGEVARGAAALRAAVGAGVRRMVAALGIGQTRGTEAQRRERATRELAMMVGAVVIARASDPDTARAVLSACRKLLDGR